MNTGFYISEIAVTGKNKPDARLSFKRGANLICGGSDTGKSFIFTAISYVFGRSKPPKQIVESQGYTNYYVEIRTFNDDTAYTLLRRLDSNKISNEIIVKKTTLSSFKNPTETQHLKANTRKLEDAISNFLLELCSLSGSRLLKSKTSGKTVNLSFSNLIQYLFIYESDIIKEDSPFYPSGQYISRTLEQALLKLFLTGIDFSDIKEIENVQKKELQLNGKLEFINSKIINYAKERTKIETEKIENYSEYTSESFIDLNIELEKNIALSQKMTDELNSLSNEISSIDEKMRYFNDLLERFKILEKQYLSDKERLEFIAESESLSSQLGDAYCPVCGNLMKDDHIKHLREIENFNKALEIELAKINSKLSDLREAISTREKDIASLSTERIEQYKQYEFLKIKLNEGLSPRIASIRGDIQKILNLAKLENQMVFIEEEVEQLASERDRINELITSKKDKPTDSTIVPAYLLSDLGMSIENRLNKWKFDDSCRITFDQSFKVFDIIIGAKPRSSYGKGKRALAYSACIFGILDYCLKNNRNFSNLLILDSPLTTFKGKGEVMEQLEYDNRKISVTTKDLFFKDLSKTSKNCQIIIFDNEIPKPAYSDKLNTQVFSGDKTYGRFGFFPIKD